MYRNGNDHISYITIIDTKSSELFHVAKDGRWKYVQDSIICLRDKTKDALRDLTSDYVLYDTRRVYSVMVISPISKDINSNIMLGAIHDNIDHKSGFKCMGSFWKNGAARMLYSFRAQSNDSALCYAHTYESYRCFVRKQRLELGFEDIISDDIQDNAIIFITTRNVANYNEQNQGCHNDFNEFIRSSLVE